MNVANKSTDEAIPRLAYSPSEAAQALGVNRWSIYRLVERGQLRANKILRHWLIPAKELERFLEKQEVGE